MSDLVFLNVDKNSELSIRLPDSSKGGINHFKIGKVAGGRGYFFSKLMGATKTIQLANQRFVLNEDDIQSLKERTISKLPFSAETKDLLLRLFNQIFDRKEISEKEFLFVIDAGQKFDRFRTRAIQLSDTTSPLSADDLHFIFGTEEKIKKNLQNIKNLSPIIKAELLKTYHDLLAPLIAKAKQEIQSTPRHLTAQAAAEKGKALQSGLKTIMALETKKISPSETSDKVSLYPETGSVFKRGEAQSREEEEQVDALMSLSMEKGNVPFFSFSELSSQRFNTSNDNASSALTIAQDDSSVSEDATAKEKAPQLQSANAKPYIEGMLTFDDLLSNDVLHQRIIDRLNQNSQLKAVLSAEFQLLDIHKDNIGAVPILAPEHQIFQDALFAHGLKSSVPFHRLIKDFLSGNIDENTKIYFATRDKQNKSNGFQPIKEIPGLLKALNSPWELVLFDIDKALAESNEIQTQMRDMRFESLVPFRSVLLGSPWKNKPLSKETTDILQNALRDQRVRDWVNRKDAPIRKWMKNPAEIDQLIKKVVEQEKYTLSFHRRQGFPKTVEDLKKVFSKDLSNLDLHPDIWAAIQKQLSIGDANKGWFKPYVVREGDSIQKIAKTYHLTVEELKTLNPEIGDISDIEPGMRLRVRDDLTSNSRNSKRLRKRIAGQFFPRLSWKQRDALFERQDRRNEYLQNVERLTQINVYSLEMVRELKRIILSPSTPLSSGFKKECLYEIQTFLNAGIDPKFGAQEFLALVKDLQVELTPTYLNLAMAMYPLLADVYFLLIFLSKLNDRTAGLNIGLYSRPLELIFNEIKSHEKYMLYRSLTERLENIISELKKSPTAFFGEWSDEEQPPDFDTLIRKREI